MRAVRAVRAARHTQHEGSEGGEGSEGSEGSEVRAARPVRAGEVYLAADVGCSFFLRHTGISAPPCAVHADRAEPISPEMIPCIEHP